MFWNRDEGKSISHYGQGDIEVFSEGIKTWILASRNLQFGVG